MKKFISLLALSLCTVSSFAQTAESLAGLPQPPDTEGERNRIQAERMREEARYQTEEAACYAKFAVFDCVHAIRVHRREALEILRRQEITLNDAERKRKGLEQLERITEKSSAQRLEEAQARRLDARAAQQEREDKAAQKAAELKAKSVPDDGKKAEKTVEPGRSAEEMTKDQQQYKDKLKAAQEHRASVEKSNAEKTGTPAKPLPVAP